MPRKTKQEKEERASKWDKKQKELLEEFREKVSQLNLDLEKSPTWKRMTKLMEATDRLASIMANRLRRSRKLKKVELRKLGTAIAASLGDEILEVIHSVYADRLAEEYAKLVEDSAATYRTVSAVVKQIELLRNAITISLSAVLNPDHIPGRTEPFKHGYRTGYHQGVHDANQELKRLVLRVEQIELKWLVPELKTVEEHHEEKPLIDD